MQPDESCDVLVVGAGPGGSIAAKTIAEEGYDVLVLEKKQEIGPPKRCAEGLNRKVLDQLNIKPDSRWAINMITGAYLYAPSGSYVDVSLDHTKGFVLERKIFEKDLAADAIKSGARYMVKTTAKEVIEENGYVTGVKAKHMGEEFNVHAKIVIAADGVDSKIARTAGLNTINEPKDYHSGFQYEMAGVNLDKEDKLHLFFGEEISYKGYLWVFPKGEGIANVGTGIHGASSEEGKRAKDYVDAFIENHPEIFKDASPVEVNSGGIPVGRPIESYTKNGFMVIGDAAHQVNPIHGGGIGLAMQAGFMAGEVAAEAIEEEDYSHEFLSKYQDRWDDNFKGKLSRLYRLRSFMEKISDEEFELFTEILDGEDIYALTESRIKFLVKLLGKKAPKLYPLAKRFLT